MKNERLSGGSGCKTFVVDDTLLKRYNGNDEYLRLPGFIYGIGDKAFARNKTLKNVNLSSNVIIIGESAFDGCKSLEELSLPYELKAIGKFAFNGCVALTSIIFNGTKERWFSVKKGEHWLEGTPDLIISCKDGNITKQEEIELESEPAINIDFSENKISEGSRGNSLDDERREYLERRRRELIERMQREMNDEDAENEDEQEQDEVKDERIKFYADKFQAAAKEVEDDEEYDDLKDIRHKALKFCMKKGYASASLIQRRFTVGFIGSRKILEWMLEEGYIENNGQDGKYDIIITEEEFNLLTNTAVLDDSENVSVTNKLLDKISKQQAVKDLATLLTRISEKKQGEIATDSVPSNSMWSDEAEFNNVVMERLEKLVRSNLKMARRGALKKAETYLEAVRDTRDGQMIQVYERIVYELKITSDSLYNQIRNCIRDE